MSKPFPKIWALGHRHTHNIFRGPCEITEKVDGSQFAFGRINGEIVMRSKGREIPDIECDDKLFKPAVDHVRMFRHLVPDNTMFYTETLCRPRHNVLRYDRTPDGYMALFGVLNVEGEKFVTDYNNLSHWASVMEIEAVPVLFYGQLIVPVEGDATNDDRKGAEVAIKLLEKESFLGGTKVEGIVIKNYAHDFLIGGQQYVPIQMAKYVSEVFKKQHDKNAYGNKARKQSIDEFIKSFRTEARFQNAVQHLREDGKLLGEPKDIGSLIPEINRDFDEEELCGFIDHITDKVVGDYVKQVRRTIISGFPEWYKKHLATGGINGAFDVPEKEV